jgi:ribosome-binding ATPase
MQIGIVGLPFAGKSTLYQAITKTHIDPAALARAEAHHSVVKVPDPRLEALAGVFKPQRVVNATIEFVDVVGLKKGETGSTQFTTNFLGNVKNNDALIQVVRVFANDAVPHPDGSVDPMRDIATFETEFLLSDMGVLETRIERIRKQAHKAGDEQAKRELPLLERCHAALEAEKPLRTLEFTREEMQQLKTYQLLSIKPMLIALNLDERQQEESATLAERVRGLKGSVNTRVLTFFGKIEMEIAELAEDEARTFMDEYGITESALTTLIHEAYTLQGLRSFFTVGEDECRAWTIRQGMNAQESAGVIHSDFFARFIRAEVVHYDDLMAHGGSFPKTKEAGLWRLEGKEYPVKDGDVLTIRHS